MLHDERVRRYPVGFTFDGNRGLLPVQPMAFDLLPLWLVVAEPSADAVLRLRFGDADPASAMEFVVAPPFDGWAKNVPVQSRYLQIPIGPLVLWKSGTRATIEVTEGRVVGASLICARAPECDRVMEGV